MMYVEVIYLKDNQYVSRKWVDCSTEESEGFFLDVVRMMTDEETECLVALRNDAHILIKSKLLKS
jgi:hypothetical protein